MLLRIKGPSDLLFWTGGPKDLRDAIPKGSLLGPSALETISKRKYVEHESRPKAEMSPRDDKGPKAHYHHEGVF